jgi:Flp pilus assembly protein TadG
MSDRPMPMSCRRGSGTEARSARGAIARLGRRLAALRDDVRGVAAVEFGLVAPVMLLFLLGTIEVTRAVAINQRFGQAVNTIADLVAREGALTADDVNAIYGIAEEIMRPYEIDDLSISIIPVMSSPTDGNNTRVYASTTNRPSFNGGSQPARCQSYSLTSGMLGTTEALIVVEGIYHYRPMFTGYLLGSQDWTHKAMTKPRIGLCVKFDADCTNPCFS